MNSRVSNPIEMKTTGLQSKYEFLLNGLQALSYGKLIHLLKTRYKIPGGLLVPMQRVLIILGYSFFISALLIVLLITIPLMQEIIIPTGKFRRPQVKVAELILLKDQTETMEKDIRRLEEKLAALVPWSPFLVINTSQNEFYIYTNRKRIYGGKCSTGSYILLTNGDTQKWLFKTPRGRFRVQGKTTSPVWIKPDWAFVEAGLPVPPSNHPSRYEYGVLGDYALSLGDGYLIHGTLYQRFLGLPVTHGCVRLNDADLETVYHALQPGSRVYIY